MCHLTKLSRAFQRWNLDVSVAYLIICIYRITALRISGFYFTEKDFLNILIRLNIILLIKSIIKQIVQHQNQAIKLFYDDFTTIINTTNCISFSVFFCLLRLIIQTLYEVVILNILLSTIVYTSVNT